MDKPPRPIVDGRIWPGAWSYDADGIAVRHSKPAPVEVWNLDPPPEIPEPEPQPEPIWYTIQPGDSWWRIAHNHRMTIEELQELNPAAVGKVLHPGQQLIIGY